MYFQLQTFTDYYFIYCSLSRICALQNAFVYMYKDKWRRTNSIELIWLTDWTAAQQWFRRWCVYRKSRYSETEPTVEPCVFLYRVSSVGTRHSSIYKNTNTQSPYQQKKNTGLVVVVKRTQIIILVSYDDTSLDSVVSTHLNEIRPDSYFEQKYEF